MTIVSKPKQSKIIVDTTGPAGNAYAILGLCGNLHNQIMKDEMLRLLVDEDFPEDFEVISKEMKSGDYNNLLGVADKYFGRFVEFQV